MELLNVREELVKFGINPDDVKEVYKACEFLEFHNTNLEWITGDDIYKELAYKEYLKKMIEDKCRNGKCTYMSVAYNGSIGEDKNEVELYDCICMNCGKHAILDKDSIDIEGV